MADKTGIEWTDATWNPLRGCSRVSEGCRHCYAEGVAKRFSGPGLPYEGLIAKGGQWNGQIKLVPELLDQPLKWSRPRRIFVNSMSDLFHENVSENYVARVFDVMARAPQHTFQILTKRPDRMKWVVEWIGRLWERDEEASRLPWPLPNVWLGVSVEDQATANARIPLLLETPAAVRWISAEPLLAAVDLSRWMDPTGVTCMDVCPDDRYVDQDSYEQMNVHGHMEPICQHCGAVASWTGYDDGIDWVVVGGESGREARPMHPDWALSLRDQCAAAGVPFLFKQWGEWAPADRETCSLSVSSGYIHPTLPNLPKPPERRPLGIGYGPHELEELGCAYIAKVGKKAAGRLLDGVQHDGYPEVRS